MKDGFERAQVAMAELGMKALLEENQQWQFAFGDVGELTQDADDELLEELSQPCRHRGTIR